MLALFAVFSAAAVSVAELHPIIEIETDYFFGASENEKWIKAEQAAESVSKKTTYQVYGLTKQRTQIRCAKYPRSLIKVPWICSAR